MRTSSGSLSQHCRIPACPIGGTLEAANWPTSSCSMATRSGITNMLKTKVVVKGGGSSSISGKAHLGHADCSPSSNSRQVRFVTRATGWLHLPDDEPRAAASRDHHDNHGSERITLDQLTNELKNFEISPGSCRRSRRAAAAERHRHLRGRRRARRRHRRRPPYLCRLQAAVRSVGAHRRGAGAVPHPDRCASETLSAARGHRADRRLGTPRHRCAACGDASPGVSRRRDMNWT